MNSTHTLSAMQSRLLDVFKRVVLFLNDNNFTWWTDGGTTIGAVRHKGFIPWDDDIDIMMPYKDYKRLQNMQAELRSYDLALDIPFEKNNCCTYIKIYDIHSSVWQVESLESIIGLWIDVFPLYRSNMSINDFKKSVNYFTKLNDDYIAGIRKPLFKDFLNLLKGFHLRGILYWLKGMTWLKCNLSNTINKAKCFLESLDTPDGEFYIFPFSYYNNLNRFPIEWFSDTILMPFEDITVNVMSGYDALLRYQFGDYMTPPPKEKQVSHHSFFFIDLNQKFTKSEIKQILSKNIKRKCQQRIG